MLCFGVESVRNDTFCTGPNHGKGNEYHDIIWHEYLTNSLLDNPIGWRGNKQVVLPDNFFYDPFPIYDYKNIDNVIKEAVLVDGWIDSNQFIKTNLFRLNQTHFETRLEQGSPSRGKSSIVLDRSKTCSEIEKSDSIV